jgi:hypothetical protein
LNRGRALSQLSACLQGRIPADADWPSILTLANEAFVTPQLSRALNAPGVYEAPEDVRAFVEEVHRRSCLRNESLFATLRDALAALNASGMTPVLLKGCALWPLTATAASPNTARLMTDLDLLTTGPAFDLSIKALTAAGFEILSDDRHEAHAVVEMGRGRDVGSIDLHQSPPGGGGFADLKALLDASPIVSVAGGQAKAPPPELQILIGLLHDQFLDGHFWRGGFELRRLTDIAALANRTPEPNWRLLQSIACRAGLADALSAHLLAAREIAGAAVPSSLLGGWGRLHYWRQRAQFVWPGINAPFHAIGLNKNVWRSLSSDRTTKA